MALADPQSVTIGTTPGAVSLPRTGLDAKEGYFSSSDGATKLRISHQYGKRNRHTVRLDYQKTAADPLVSGSNAVYSMSAYLVVDAPVSGFTVTEQKDVAVALMGFLTASTNAATTKVLGGES